MLYGHDILFVYYANKVSTLSGANNSRSQNITEPIRFEMNY